MAPAQSLATGGRHGLHRACAPVTSDRSMSPGTSARTGLGLLESDPSHGYRAARPAPTPTRRTTGGRLAQEEERCSPPFSVRSGRLTCARSCCSRWHHRGLPARAPRCPARASRTATCRQCLDSHAGRRPTRRLHAAEPVLRRRAAAAVGLRARHHAVHHRVSIILQLLTVVIPRLEQLKKEGQAGQAKLTQYTRYLTIGLAILQSTGVRRAGPLAASCSSGCSRPTRSSPRHRHPFTPGHPGASP